LALPIWTQRPASATDIIIMKRRAMEARGTARAMGEEEAILFLLGGGVSK
jgi:hypothetical protein